MYNTSQNYKNKVLNDSTQHELNIYIDNNKIEPNHIIDFKCILELFNNSEFCLGCTPEIDIEFEIDKRDLPEAYNEVRVESGLEDEIIPVGKFTIQSVEDNEFKVKIKATDYMKKFEDNKYDGSDLTYPATMLQVLQDICTKIGVELGSTSFLNSDKQISVYDNTVSARTYLSYIAEQAEGFAVIGRDGKLYIKTFGKDTASININLFADFEWGEKFKVSRVSYEDGTRNYKFGDETASTVYINQNNMYIVDSEQVENIYNQIKDFEVYSFEGETIIDPAYDIGDIFVIDGRNVLYQGELEYAGKFKVNIKSMIQTKTKQESMQTKENTSKKIKRVQSQINQIDGKITQLAQETTENTEKVNEIQTTVDGTVQRVSETETRLNNDYLNKEQIEAENQTLKDDIDIVKKQQTTIRTTAQGLQVQIDKINNEGVKSVKNTTVDINENGVTVGKSDSEFSTTMNNAGTYMYAYGKQIAKYDKDGAETTDFKATGDVEIGYLKIIKGETNGERRTHIHFVG